MNTEEMFLKNMSYQNNEINTENIDTQNMQSDGPLLIAVIFLVVIGLMTIFSATAPKCIEMNINPAKFVIQQFLGVIAGFVGLKFLSNFHYKKLMTYTLPFALFVIVMLIMVKVAGVTVNGAQRWINIGPLNLQPSEFAKPAIVLLLAGVFYRNTQIFDNNKIVVAFIPILIMLGLIFVQPNLSMLMLLLATSVAIYICAGGSVKLFLISASCFIPLLLLKGMRGYQSSRITTWLHPEADPLGAGYNVLQSLVAFASGGIVGVGYGSSKQKLAWLPESHTDFIYAVIGEEHGFIGCLMIICLFWTILQRGFLIATKCQDMYGKLLALGLTFSICFQGFLNMWVASSFTPATGVPMPFVSYGGSSVMVSLWMVGILLNISKDNVKRIRNYSNVRNI
ncbi:MAG: rod shape-determining protein RodA [Cyanobacteria bacterium SIG28]|nr:rod shape-determining protein RodA [Cyanobacteria bacterium SIG28]